VSRQRWRTGATRISDDQVTAMVARARADIAALLGDALDDEVGLARIYAMHGQQAPARPGPAQPDDDADESGQVQAVCDRIAMLETTLAQAAKPGGPSSLAGMYLGMARRFLFELRSGLAGHSLAAEDAFRLLNNVRHDLHEADQTLRREQRLPLGQTVLTRLGELRDLTSDLIGQTDALGDKVMRLFGHSEDPATAPVPHH
jgi:hypothetical protein